MHIVHVITRLIVGGAQENTLLSCAAQHRAGHRVTLITGPSTGPEGSLMARATGEGYTIEELPQLIRAVRPITDYSAYRALRARFRQLQPDVIHTHSSKAGILARWAARKIKSTSGRTTAVVHTIHGLAFTASSSAIINAAYRYAEKFTAPLTHRIVSVADDMTRQSLAGGVGKPSQYVTVYSGMDTAPFLSARPAFRSATRAALGLSDSHIVVGTVARLFEKKGHDDLLDIAPALCQQFPQLRFLWVGDGSLRSHLQSRIDAAGLSSRILFSGLVPPSDVPKFISAMDILVHPSYREGLARAIPQAQLTGAPVIAYDVDGNREGLQPNATGLLVPLADKPALSAALSRLLADSTLRQQMGAAGQSFAAARFDTSAMAQGLELVYQQAIAAANPAA